MKKLMRNTDDIQKDINKLQEELRNSNINQKTRELKDIPDDYKIEVFDKLYNESLYNFNDVSEDPDEHYLWESVMEKTLQKPGENFWDHYNSIHN